MLRLSSHKSKGQDLEPQVQALLIKELSGWLFKRGENPLSAYKKRWFYVSEMFYWEYTTSPEKRKPQGRIDLRDIESVKDLNENLEFEVTTTGRTFKMKALSESDLRIWIPSIQELSLKASEYGSGRIQSAMASKDREVAMLKDLLANLTKSSTEEINSLKTEITKLKEQLAHTDTSVSRGSAAESSSHDLRIQLDTLERDKTTEINALREQLELIKASESRSTASATHAEELLQQKEKEYQHTLLEISKEKAVLTSSLASIVTEKEKMAETVANLQARLDNNDRTVVNTLGTNGTNASITEATVSDSTPEKHSAGRHTEGQSVAAHPTPLIDAASPSSRVLSNVDDNNTLPEVKKKYFAALGRAAKIQGALCGWFSSVDLESLFERAMAENVSLEDWPTWIALAIEGMKEIL
ncbi:hypothetical protein Pelo_12678 [Pelomyxa schiedti]|nr:hypothetical protein Pelo_12678 [Pelomyxa schiedti]